MGLKLKTTILGSGCSTGVPRIDGYWGACDPQNPKNRRSRCSAWFALYEESAPEVMTSVVTDTSPDFRNQMLAAQVPHLDAVLWTHDHADQTHGLDDMRAFTFARSRPIDGYFDAATRDTLTARFGYVFKGNMGYPPVCEPHFIPPHGAPWHISGKGGNLPIITFDQEHGPIRSVGYRLGDVAYSSDVSNLPEASFAALKGLKVWIVDALRHKPHPTHAHLAKTLEWVRRIRPERTILTNLHQEMDYAALKAELPDGVEPAYDQMTFITDI
ncbi:MAG: MBL fold metallo-hydrolase [Asticcacaulis sp.]